MILNEDAVRSMAQEAADRSNKEQLIFQRSTGEYVFCAKGNQDLLKQYLRPGETIKPVATIRPTFWPTE